MCGILYVKLRNDIDKNFSSIFKEALQLLAYRGKDATGYYQKDNNHFGHTRLSILDLSSRSNQPIVNPNNIILFKGEIYNYKQLVPQAHSDTLAIAHMIENEIDIADKLCGMYAILIYQKQNRSVKVLRDFYGEKPIYYFCNDKIFIVSSTIKAITYILNKTFNIKLKINSHSFYEFLLSGYVREPKTIFDEIHMLNSGHILNFSADWKLEILNNFKNILTHTPLDTKEYVENSLRTTDVQPGLLLSSGVDSTYLLSLIRTFNNINFKILTYKSSTKNQDESLHAVMNAQKIYQSKEINIDIIENHQEILQLYANYPNILEQPSADGLQLFNILSVSRDYNHTLKLILLGTGGDELYGGYNSFKNYQKISIIKKFSCFKNLLPTKYRRFFEINSQKQYSIESYYFLYRLCHHCLPYIPRNIFEEIFSEFTTEMQKYGSQGLTNPHQKIKLFESFDYMRNQLLRDADNISLYCGYEARNPLLAVAAYLKHPDGKQSMKYELMHKYGITFGCKKGFTLCESNNKILFFLLNKIQEYNLKFNVIPQCLIHYLINTKPANFYLSRKIYILLAWLNSNKIETQQLYKIQT